MAFLTDRTLATGVTVNDLIHIVVTGDTSQNPAGSSFKATLGQFVNILPTFTGGSGNCITDFYVTNIYGCSPITIKSETNILNNVGIYGNLLVTGITSANTVVITSTPTTASTLDEVIVRDSSSGELKYYDFTHVNVGLFTQTGNSTPISATTSELTLIDGGIGSLTIPANFFKPGDSFRLRMGGIVSAINNDTLTIRVKGNSVTLGTDIITFPTTSNRSWMLDIDFIIRTIGGVGVASIVSNGFFTFTRISEDLLGGGFVVIENTNFDTTITNTLDITAEWSSNDVSNSIYSTNFVLTKTF
jgi:hypothetical protein